MTLVKVSRSDRLTFYQWTISLNKYSLSHLNEVRSGVSIGSDRDWVYLDKGEKSYRLF